MLVPLSKPIIGQNGEEIKEVVVPRGTNVMISILGSNTDPDLWGTDAREWKPERWLFPLPARLGEAHLPGIYSNLYV
jgi:cytochrome P450